MALDDDQIVRQVRKIAEDKDIGDGPQPSLTTARSPTSPSVSPGAAPANSPDTGEGGSICRDRRASQPSVRADR
jgi:hypothetical protein